MTTTARQAAARTYYRAEVITPKGNTLQLGPRRPDEFAALHADFDRLPGFALRILRITWSPAGASVEEIDTCELCDTPAAELFNRTDESGAEVAVCECCADTVVIGCFDCD